MQHERGPRKPKVGKLGRALETRLMETHSEDSCSPSPPPQSMQSNHPQHPAPHMAFGQSMFPANSLDSPMDLSSTSHRASYPIMPLDHFAKFNPFVSMSLAAAKQQNNADGYAHNLQMDKFFPSPIDAAMINRSRFIMSLGHGGPIFPHSSTGDSNGIIHESLQESSARLLFSIVHWLRNVPSFMALPCKDQVCMPEYY